MNLQHANRFVSSQCSLEPCLITKRLNRMHMPLVNFSYLLTIHFCVYGFCFVFSCSPIANIDLKTWLLFTCNVVTFCAKYKINCMQNSINYSQSTLDSDSRCWMSSVCFQIFLSTIEKQIDYLKQKSSVSAIKFIRCKYLLLH